MPVPNLLRLSLELSLAGLTNSSFVLIGTTVMYVHGIVPRTVDIDMFVSEDGYSKLKTRGWVEEWPTEGDPPMLAWDCDGQRVNAWHRWDDRHIGGEIVAEAFETREFVAGWPCVPLSVLKRWKQIAGRPKDRTHIALIEEHERGVEIVRADGGCKCVCGREYRDHPLFDELPTHHILCDGTVVKL